MRVPSELLSKYDTYECLCEHSKVEPKRLVLKIIKVKFEATQHLLYGVGVAVVERCVGGDAWADSVELLIAWVALHNLVDVEFAFGTITDERHIATNYIPQLRQLIEMMGTQEATHTREARVVQSSFKQQLRSVFLGVARHAAELIYVEWLAVQPNALLPIYRWRTVFEPNGNDANQK